MLIKWGLDTFNLAMAVSNCNSKLITLSLASWPSTYDEVICNLPTTCQAPVFLVKVSRKEIPSYNLALYPGSSTCRMGRIEPGYKATITLVYLPVTLLHLSLLCSSSLSSFPSLFLSLSLPLPLSSLYYRLIRA